MRGFRLWAGWVVTDEVFVQLLRVCDVVLPLFQLGGLEQFLQLVPAQAARSTQKTTAPMWIHCLIISPITLTVSATGVGRVSFVSSD